MELKLTQSSLPTPIFNPSSLLPKDFSVLAQRWKLDIQRITWKGHVMSKKILLHVVKEGETLTSISKLYGVPILEISASNEEIADVNVVFEGQCLKIPSAVAECARWLHFKRHLLQNGYCGMGFHIKRWNQIFATTFPQFPVAKTTGSLPVLVAVVALCIGCIIRVLQIVLSKNIRHKSANKSTNTARWRTALSDLRDPEGQNAESVPDSDPLPADSEQFQLEDASYTHNNKLEGEYQKFLAECGMSKYGYWRGGDS